MDLSNLKKPASKRAKRRVGRGEASGWGKTSGRGHKGQKARSGGTSAPGFEGGQMPLQRRLPKRGFTNKFKIVYNIVNLKDLASLEAGAEVTGAGLREMGLVKRKGPVKVLAMGDVSVALTVKVDAISAQARSKIEVAGGKVETL